MTISAEFTYDVFISYSSVDSEHVLDFVAALRNTGITYFIDKMGIGWGESIVEKVFSGIERSRYVIVYVSSHSLKSPWVKKEILTAFQREIESDAVTLLPILACPHDEFEQTFPFLRGKKYISAGDNDQIVEKLIELLRGTANTIFTFNHPRAYHGPVWLRLLAEASNDDVIHRLTIRWGTWYREFSVSISHRVPLFLTHSKGDDGESIPILVHLDKPAYVTAGQGMPNSVHCVDINPFWVDAKSRVKKLIARTLLWP